VDRQTNVASPFCFNFRLHIARLVSLISADETREKCRSRYKLQGSGGPEGGPGPGARGPCMLKIILLFSLVQGC